MTFDLGPLNGWPEEPASWAPYHALHLLGMLQAMPFADRLLTLAGCANDWLSDRLPTVWTWMGPPVEPALWSLIDDDSYVNKERGLVVAGLRSLTAAYPEQRSAVIAGLVRRLKDPAFAEPSVNAYIVFVLNRMKATPARRAIIAAFEQGKVDTNIMQPSDVQL